MDSPFLYHRKDLYLFLLYSYVRCVGEITLNLPSPKNTLYVSLIPVKSDTNLNFERHTEICSLFHLFFQY